MANYASNYTGQDLDNSIKLSKGSIAELYSASKTYAVGAYVIYNGDLYKCNTAITTAEAFDVTKWDRKTVIDAVSSIDLQSLGITATAAEINVLDGITVSTASLNKVDQKMTFKGTVGTGGTVTTLPTSGVCVGDTYEVITQGTYSGQDAKLGDLFIALTSAPLWRFLPTGPAIVSETTLVI